MVFLEHSSACLEDYSRNSDQGTVGSGQCTGSFTFFYKELQAFQCSVSSSSLLMFSMSGVFPVWCFPSKTYWQEMVHLIVFLKVIIGIG